MSCIPRSYFDRAVVGATRRRAWRMLVTGASGQHAAGCLWPSHGLPREHAGPMKLQLLSFRRRRSPSEWPSEPLLLPASELVARMPRTTFRPSSESHRYGQAQGCSLCPSLLPPGYLRPDPGVTGDPLPYSGSVSRGREKKKVLTPWIEETPGVFCDSYEQYKQSSGWFSENPGASRRKCFPISFFLFLLCRFLAKTLEISISC
jgi:hypothetical protein